MVKFVDGQIDVLVSTAIVESGLDIPASNTIIINRADRFGLAQLYQLRGRVGRERSAGVRLPSDPGRRAGRRDGPAAPAGVRGDDRAGRGLPARDARSRDPGVGQPPGRAAARAHRGGGLRSLHEAPRRGGARIEGRAGGSASIRSSWPTSKASCPRRIVPEVNQRLALYKRLAEIEPVTRSSPMRAELADRFGPLPPAEEPPRHRGAARRREGDRRRADRGRRGQGRDHLRAVDVRRRRSAAGRGDPGQSRTAAVADGVHAGGGDRHGRVAGRARRHCAACWAGSPFDDAPPPGSLRDRPAAVRMRHAELGSVGRQAEPAPAEPATVAGTPVGPPVETAQPGSVRMRPFEAAATTPSPTGSSAS